MSENNLPVTGARAIEIRNIILQDKDAVARWKEIKNELIKSTMERISVNRLLESGHCRRAVLTSLHKWSTSQPQSINVDNLIEILNKFELQSLADKLKEPETQKRICDAPQLAGFKENDSRFPFANFKIDASRYEICSIISEHPESSRHWSLIKDLMVTDVETNLRIDSDLDDGGRVKLFSAVSETINFWIQESSTNANFHTLLGILVDHGLQACNTCKDEFMSSDIVSRLRQLEGIGPEVDSSVRRVTDANPDAARYQICPVCKEDSWDHMIKCGHFICEKCLEKLLSTKPNCCICREPFKADDVTRAYIPY